MLDKRFSFFNKFSSHIKKNIADVKYFFTIDKEISADFKDFKDKIVSLTSILKYSYKDFIDLSLAGCLDDNLESLQKQIKDSFTTMQSIYEKEICGFTNIGEIK
jgi:hypothetical protein